MKKIICTIAAICLAGSVFASYAAQHPHANKAKNHAQHHVVKHHSKKLVKNHQKKVEKTQVSLVNKAPVKNS